MDAGTLFLILLIGGGVLAMFFMHRGGHSHGGLGGGHGGHGGHGHGGTSTDESREPRNEDTKPLAKPGAHGQTGEPATSGGKHRGC